jgi:uncharacterized membrane protein
MLNQQHSKTFFFLFIFYFIYIKKKIDKNKQIDRQTNRMSFHNPKLELHIALNV